MGGATQESTNPAYEVGVGSTQPSHDHTTSPDQEQRYQPVNYTHPPVEISQTNEGDYNRLDRGKNGHKATSKSLEQCKQNKTSSTGYQVSKELESAYMYGELEKEISDVKKDSEEHIYHILEGPSN